MVDRTLICILPYPPDKNMEHYSHQLIMLTISIKDRVLPKVPFRSKGINKKHSMNRNAFKLIRTTTASELIQRLLQPVPANGLILNPSYIPMRENQKVVHWLLYYILWKINKIFILFRIRHFHPKKEQCQYHCPEPNYRQKMLIAKICLGPHPLLQFWTRLNLLPATTTSQSKGQIHLGCNWLLPLCRT